MPAHRRPATGWRSGSAQSVPPTCPARSPASRCGS
jgi:hypothetical protein